MYGWTGTMLRIDLTTGKVTRESTDMDIAQNYIGARGMGGKILADEVDPKVDALGPDNKLIFAPGPFTGTFAPSAGRFNVVTKSPLNGTIAVSNSGGAFGTEVKYAGYDAIIIEGQSSKPVFLWIKDDRVQIRDAGGLWGLGTPDTTDRVREETEEDAAVSCIGPAGENLSPMASIMNDVYCVAGRTGVGAVMGSKNLKAIAVLGSGAVKVADRKPFKSCVLKARRKILAHPANDAGAEAYGALSARNFQDSCTVNVRKIDEEPAPAGRLMRSRGCVSCIVSSGHVTRIDDPEHAGFGEAPEFETAWGLGAGCGIDNVDAITKANCLCDEYGIDAISMGGTIACAMELFERGYLTKEDTDGIDLTFGNAAAMVEMVHRTGQGEGFGKRLAEGSYRLAESCGHPELSMTVKKQEMPACDPRCVQGVGLNAATNNLGGCRVRGYATAVEALGDGTTVDPHVTTGTADEDVLVQNLAAALDSSGACLFSAFVLGAADLAEMLTALTGVTYSLDDFMRAGERIWNNERLWNLENGYTSADDTLPERLLKDPIKRGPSKGEVSRLDQMLPEYYRARGWDSSGVPTAAKLEELALQPLRTCG